MAPRPDADRDATHRTASARLWDGCVRLVCLITLLAAGIAPAAAAECRALLRAYPHALQACEGGVLVWKDGTRMVFDDGRTKTFEGMLDAPDLQDMLALPYPAFAPAAAPPPDFDPGRFRNDAFFRKMYGESAQAVRAQLATIRWLPSSANVPLLVTTVGGVDKHLAAVSAELDRLLPSFRPYLAPPAGTFKWRVIKDTHRLSAHSFGIAIDINAARSDYWLWDQKRDGSFSWRNRIPMEIVRIFEKHGFIWGGRWSHYDTMHFEYRPELLPPE